MLCYRKTYQLQTFQKFQMIIPVLLLQNYLKQIQPQQSLFMLRQWQRCWWSWTELWGIPSTLQYFCCEPDLDHNCPPSLFMFRMKRCFQRLKHRKSLQEPFLSWSKAVFRVHPSLQPQVLGSETTHCGLALFVSRSSLCLWRVFVSACFIFTFFLQCRSVSLHHICFLDSFFTVQDIYK